MSYTCVIIEDEFPARRLLADYIKERPELELLASFSSATEGREFLERNAVQILFLDIQLPDINGLDMLRSMDKQPQVILTTAYADYALEGFNLKVTDYLLKPFSPERFGEAVDTAIENINLRKGNGTAKPEREYLMIRADYKTIRVYLDEIVYIEGLKEYVSIYTKEKRLITLEALKNLEQTLPGDRFARVHRSYIVAKPFVSAMGSHELEVPGKKIPIGKSYRDTVQDWFK